jgi:hypothetical protein
MKTSFELIVLERSLLLFQYVVLLIIARKYGKISRMYERTERVFNFAVNVVRLGILFQLSP